MRGTYACGTIRENRKYFPDELKNAYLNRSEYQFAVQKTFTVWHDVSFFSTVHRASIETVGKRPKGGKEKEPVPYPTAIVEYNQCMNEVDLSDQHLSYHSLSNRKTIKWWKKLLEIFAF